MDELVAFAVAVVIGVVIAGFVGRLIEGCRGRDLCRGAKGVLGSLTVAVVYGVLLVMGGRKAGAATAEAASTLVAFLILDAAFAIGRWQGRRDAAGAA